MQNTPLPQQVNQANFTKSRSCYLTSKATEKHKAFKPEQSTSKEWLSAWERLKAALGNGTIIILNGSRGAGKTQMAHCAIRETCKGERSALYSKAIDFFLNIRATYKKESIKTEREIVDDYTKPFLLVIDAIENRSESDFENLLLNYLIDSRYDDCKDTILITNQDDQAFSKSMGASIMDRICETGLVITCNWKSFRRG